MRPAHPAIFVLTMPSLALVALAACSAGVAVVGPAVDAGERGDATQDEAASVADAGADSDSGGPGILAFPRLVSRGEPQMTAPRVVTITFQGDSMAPELQAFGGSITQTAWWRGVVADYCPADAGGCVGREGASYEIPDAAAPVYVDTETGDRANLSDAGVPVWDLLSAEISAGHVPPPDTDTIYTLYVPPTTSSIVDGIHSCTSRGFHGHHGQTTVATDAGVVPIVYAVVHECSGDALGDVTTTSSHELVEAVTDGRWTARTRGWYLDESDPNAIAWGSLLGGEAADMCDDPFFQRQKLTAEGAYAVQRIWSNTQAGLSKDPCIPSGDAYFNAYPSKAFIVMNVGETRSIPVTGFSTEPRSDWTVSAADRTTDQLAPSKRYIAWNLSSGTINDGVSIELSIELLADPITSDVGFATVVLVSSDATAQRGNFWPVAIMTPLGAQHAGLREPDHLSTR